MGYILPEDEVSSIKYKYGQTALATFRVSRILCSTARERAPQYVVQRDEPDTSGEDSV